MDLGLTGKVAVVTGGSEDIGKATALSMAREGARVAIVARTKEKLDATAAEIRASGGDVIAVPCDVMDEAQVNAAIVQVIARWGGVDILVNNAGTSAARKFEDVSDDVWETDLGIKGMRAVRPSGATYSRPPFCAWRWGARLRSPSAAPLGWTALPSPPRPSLI